MAAKPNLADRLGGAVTAGSVDGECLAAEVLLICGGYLAAERCERIGKQHLADRLGGARTRQEWTVRLVMAFDAHLFGCGFRGSRAVRQWNQH